MLYFIFNLVVFLSNIRLDDGAVRGWGEICNHTSECSDHRYNCLPDSDNVYKCVCDRFHEWGGKEVGCVQIYNSSTILNMSMKMTDNLKLFEEETIRIFRQQLYGGLFVVVAVLVAALSVMGFCVVVRQSDKKLKKSLGELHRRKTTKMKPSTSVV